MRLSPIDPSSYSNAHELIVRHVDLDWTVNFENSTLSGTVSLHFKTLKDDIEEIFLDANELSIASMVVKTTAGEVPLNWDVGSYVENIGSKLTIYLPMKTSGEFTVRIEYETSPKASALQWLTAEQTFGKKHPYLFSQCQAIHARSIVPCQDTPAVKFTYNATLHYPQGVTGLMSAVKTKSDPGVSYFHQSIPIPSYLLAIVVGALVEKPIGPISSVWAEQEQVDEAAEEFSQTAEFIAKAEEICGPYVWGRYDLLVMPPSFPFGGMENPCLTFVTPTLLAGDKSLATVVAHEIAHSWTGNLVTNKNFEHFWLNEGFTVFVEGKIVGRLFGNTSRDFHSLHGLSELTDCIKTQLASTPALTKLVVDLSECSPDDAFSTVPYIKGSTFLRYLEDLLGGPEKFEPFFRSYLNKFKNQSIMTNEFKKALYDWFREDPSNEEYLERIDWDRWLFGEGMPPVIPNYDRTLLDACQKHAKLWAENELEIVASSPILSETLSSIQVIEFLAQLLEKKTLKDLTAEKIALLDKTYRIHETKNAEIRFRFVRLFIRARMMDKMDEILTFLNSNFRMKFVRPIYKELAGWPEARPIAIDNYKKVKDQMMSVCAYTVSKDLGIADNSN
ncbi:leukotriene A-4 hydrolase [Toxorhynchites rutilus septentrionalis]|uniref:leukotriene A-4 hydrolase n=1 Tax=Toxorhynchites rutilus septentrionalis TaxID=329112 RepID=UPI0024795543|nr:leukotriene A-4 hydrolase [Toxorhynchites rutilus septentrionalis]XP_055641441.1 leukotriene A-4 hydrolase [Toxorhynchites rutilus septentrionalis]XP_055641442.1 leukotriene A-4 hydrolase [Toxorhynchites rutilus septentrionalis]XP_055641445.1 leukotriene A-4 hydrolase [Toxorhynchites rutilus septentrionalis]XP_055641446.1 leukotriene A-4 hydrolase [Toxorhynchites rutilus septentrionalis]XP_055641447.1 leukotriene A-4 hydrolase [Toxorhynchites rutilus septentrionalis]